MSEYLQVLSEARRGSQMHTLDLELSVVVDYANGCFGLNSGPLKQGSEHGAISPGSKIL